jgi:putative PIG3 family NAD(P)H quinone oxidoreductase
MVAIAITSPGGPDVLKPEHRPMPVPAPREVLIRVEAAGIARADTLQRQGKYPPPPGASDIPGLDVAGIIEDLGEGVSEYLKGDRVCAILAGGGYAEFCVAPVEQVLPVPAGWTATEAVTLPENLFTAYDNLITRAALKRGEAVLIHGGTSGIGVTATQLSRAWGARVFTTAGSAIKCEASVRLGADHSINYKQENFGGAIKRLTHGMGVNVVLDMVGGAYFAENLECLALDGRLAIIATQGGRTASLDIAGLMHKRASVMGSTMRARSASEKGAVARALLRDVWPLLPAKDKIRPVIDTTYPLEEASRAHIRMEEGSHIGKIVLVNGHR